MGNALTRPDPLVARSHQTGASVIWSSAELITQRLARNKAKKPVRRYRGIHPGAHVGMQLALLAGQGTSGGITTSSRICNPYRVKPCIFPEVEVAIGTLASVLG